MGTLFGLSAITAWQLQSSSHPVSEFSWAPVAGLNRTGQKCSMGAEGKSRVGSDQRLTSAQGFSPPPPLPPSPPPNPIFPWKDKASSQFPHSLPLLPISFCSRLRRPFVKGAGGFAQIFNLSNLPSAPPVSSLVETALFALASNRILF